MAITQYRTYNSSNGTYSYSSPTASEVSQLVPACGDWMAIRTASGSYVILAGDFKNGRFTGDGFSVSTSGISGVTTYTDEVLTIYNNAYVFSNLDGYKCVANIRADASADYMIQFCGFVLCAILVIGGAFKCVRSLFSSRRRFLP